MSTEGSPLSPQQARQWALFGERGALPAAVARVAIHGALEGETLERALALVAAKHEVLRTRYVGAPEPAQVPRDEPAIAWEHRDFSAESPTEQAQRLEAAFDEARRAVFAPADAAELRAVLLRTAPDAATLLVALPALSMDRVGFANLVADLAAACASLSGGAAFDDEAMQYADVAAWELELLESDESAPGRDHWRGVDLTSGAGAAIPFECTAEPEYRPEYLARTLAALPVARVHEVATGLGIAPRDLLFTAWATLLRRLGTEDDLLLGFGASGRQYEELEEPLGLLERDLPVPVRVERSERFSDLARRLSGALEEAERWQECFDAQGFASRGGALEALPFGFAHRTEAEPVSAGDATFRLENAFVLADRTKCRLECVESAHGLAVALTFDAGVLGAATVERLAGQLETVIGAVLAVPETEVGRLPVLAEAERRALIEEFNATDADYPKDWLAHDWIEQAAGANPDAVAVRQGDEELTYRELDERANQLAHHLQERGVGPDTLVTLFIDRSFDMAIGIVGILKAGGAYVPIDPAYPKDRVHFLLEDTGAPVLVTKEALASDLGDTAAELVCVDRDADAIAAHPRSKPASDVKPENLVYIIYTSGSTGKPKGVVITHEKLVISNNARINWFGHTPENFLLLSSVAFDSSVVGIFWSLCAGGTLELVPQGLEKDIAEIPRIIAAHGVSHLLTLPSFYRLILEQADPAQLAGMRAVIVAGEACPLKMVEHHKRALPGVGLFSEYGATETTVFSSVYDCLEQTIEIAPVGGPIDNAEMYVLDEHLAPCPTGVPGEVHFGGVALALGYWRRPELTAERFVPSPFGTKPGARLYKSGDLARHLENGDVEFLGRLDNQVKIRGYRIELEEIEVAMLKHPALKETAVLARADDGGEKRLVGYALTEEGHQTPTTTEVRDFLCESLPEFMAPAVILFLDDFPRTPNGKVDRKALPEPGSERPELESEFQEAGSTAERVLADIWCAVLGLESVGVNDNFFELGGDSILSIQIVARAKQAGFAMSARHLFENQTIAELAEAVPFDEAAARAADGDAEGAATGQVPLTPVQRWFFELGLPEPAHWSMPLLVDVARKPSVEHLEAALAALVGHHDLLRARYTRADGAWTQEVAAGPVDSAGLVVTEDLSALAGDEQQAELERRATAHHASLDLARGPLVRVVLFDRGPDLPARMLWIVHHLVVDGVSWRILLEDLEAALTAIEAGREPELPAKTTAFKAWAEGLARYADSPALAEAAEHWRPLSGEAVPAIPLDHPGAENREDSARKVTVELTEDETRALLTEAQGTYNTQISDLLVTAMVHALANWTGSRTQLLNLEGHGREEVVEGADLSRTVGWFTTDYPVRLTEADAFEPGAAIKATKEALRAIPERGLPFGVAKHLATDAALAEAMRAVPTPVVGFNYLGQFDQVSGEDARFRYSSDGFGEAMAGSGPRVFQLEAYGLVSGGRLVMDFEYSANLHERATVERLANDFLATLRGLIEHCLDPSAGGFTASDFAEFGWDEDDLATITRAIERSLSGSAGGA